MSRPLGELEPDVYLAHMRHRKASDAQGIDTRQVSAIHAGRAHAPTASKPTQLTGCADNSPYHRSFILFCAGVSINDDTAGS